MTDGYITIAREAISEQIIEKSKFIALAARVAGSMEAAQHLQEAKSKYPNARHYVYAYRLWEGRNEKASDDGEPQGTGGRPVLDLLQHKQVWNVQIVVVRYFGGILLGTGGLTRAYGGTARLALEEAGLARLIPHIIYNLNIPYPWYEQIKYGVKQQGWSCANEQFSEIISLEIYIPEAQAGTFENWIDEFTNKQVSWTKIKLELKPDPTL